MLGTCVEDTAAQGFLSCICLWKDRAIPASSQRGWRKHGGEENKRPTEREGGREDRNLDIEGMQHFPNVLYDAVHAPQPRSRPRGAATEAWSARTAMSTPCSVDLGVSEAGRENQRACREQEEAMRVWLWKSVKGHLSMEMTRVCFDTWSCTKSIDADMSIACCAAWSTSLSPFLPSPFAVYAGGLGSQHRVPPSSGKHTRKS
jgi:hypothetical protein